MWEPAEDAKTLFLPVIPPILSREKILNHLNRVSKVEELIITDPNPLKSFNRLGWATFSTEEAAKEALSTLQVQPVFTFRIWTNSRLKELLLS